MSKAKKYDHVHKLELVYLGAKHWKAYRCVDSDCPYLIDKKLALGKLSRCWKCNEPFEIGPELRDTKRVKCKECRRNKKDYRGIYYTVVSDKPSQLIEKPKPKEEFKGEDLMDLLVTKT